METAQAYTLNAFDCPYCGFVNSTDADFASVEECEDCGEEVEVRG